MSFSASDNDPLELIINTRIRGSASAKSAAADVNQYAVAENRAAREAQTAIGVYERLRRAQEELARARSGDIKVTTERYKDLEAAVTSYQKRIDQLENPKGKTPTTYGANGRLAVVQQRLADIQSGRMPGTPDDVRDLEYRRRKLQETIDRQAQPEPTQGSLTAKAILSSRFGKSNGLMPLVGQSLDALGGPGSAKAVGNIITGVVDGPLGKVAGVAGAAVQAIVAVVKVMYKLADASSQLEQRFTNVRAAIGGTAQSVVSSQLLARITGVDAASGATAFQNKITSDPLAMGFAGRLGIHNIAGPFGNVDYGTQYRQAIERVSAIQDPTQRRRIALGLGISQEVERYALLSPTTKATLSDSAKLGGRISSTDAEKTAAEFSAAQQHFDSAKEHIITALGTGFAKNFTATINSLADLMDMVADAIDKLNKALPSNDIYNNLVAKFKHIGFALTPYEAIGKAFGLGPNGDGKLPLTPYEAIGRGLSLTPSSSGGNSYTTAVSANTAALYENSMNLARLNGTLGGGERAGSAVPSGLRGANLSRAVVSGGLRLGAL